MTAPKLRFPEFRDAGAWEERPLGSKTIKVGSGITPNGGEKNYKSKGRPFVRSQNIGWGCLLLDDVAFIDDITHSTFSATEINERDVFLNITGASIGRSAVADYRVHGGNVNQHVCIIRAEQSELNPNYLNQYLLSQYGQKQIDSFQAGGNRQGLNFAQVRSFSLPLTSIEEQQKIADCLSSIDSLIAAETQKLDTLKAHKKGLMQQLFPAEGETLPKLRFPEFRDSGDWEEHSITKLVKEDILFAPKDGNHGNLHPKSSDYVDTGIPFVMANDFKNGAIDFSRCTHITKELADTLQKGFAKEGDVLLTHKGTVGEVTLIQQMNFPYLMLTPQVTYYRIKDKSRLSNKFLALLFASESFQRVLRAAAGGGTRAYIGITEQGKLKITFSSNILEQRKIAKCLSALNELISAQTQKIATLKTHKKGLMQQLFPAIDEVAG